MLVTEYVVPLCVTDAGIVSAPESAVEKDSDITVALFPVQQ